MLCVCGVSSTCSSSPPTPHTQTERADREKSQDLGRKKCVKTCEPARAHMSKGHQGTPNHKGGQRQGAQTCRMFLAAAKWRRAALNAISSFRRLHFIVRFPMCMYMYMHYVYPYAYVCIHVHTCLHMYVHQDTDLVRQSPSMYS
jgi:hypothetical protein